MLEAGIDDFARVLRNRFIPSGDGTDEILLEYARQHRVSPTSPSEAPHWPDGT